MKILVADDNRFFRLLVQHTLVNWGFDVVSVADGTAAVEVLKQKHAPKIAILDWMMPGLTGLDVCRTIRSIDTDTPPYLLILTVRNGKEDLLEALRAGADDYLAKPFDNKELEVRLRMAQRYVTLQEKLERKVDNLEYALSEAQKMEAVGQLAGGVAHDFNKLFSSILNFTESLTNEELSQSEIQSILKLIKGAAERGTSLVRQLMAFSRRQDLHPVPINLNELVQNLCGMLSRLISSNVEVKLVPDPDLCLVEADPGQIQQVLINLIMNAHDAMPEGGLITLTTANVTTTCREKGKSYSLPEGHYVMISVADTGWGMDKATMDRMFEPFYTTKPIGKGSGLGLATSYGIIRQSGGHFRVESEPGNGSTFRFFLPQLQAEISAAITNLPMTESVQETEPQA